MTKNEAKKVNKNSALVAQLDRALDYESRGQGFESSRARQLLFYNLNSLASNMLSFWEKDFDQAINKHIKYLEENLESQNKYSSKFSKILQDMEIFQNEDISCNLHARALLFL